ncbi:hypothetical protein FAGAP_6423 [Fusarium agapanthi]|uniref:Uncharacterized protein n=1 Tax=Fusarium agapanthi TaxID=1803897 RepID=A0A9P5BEZ9_9HYPO|nr:hypothetical protein FAGAP_6423 [Fusarium agapanthi]
MARKNNRKSRRRARSKPTERFFWSTTERLQLLAYLDWCVQSCVKFEVTAPGYLKNATGRCFSKERIRRKLYQEWTKYGECKRFNDLFEQGTAGLNPLQGEEQESFYQIVASMSPAQGARCTRSRSLGLTARSIEARASSGPTRTVLNNNLSEDELTRDHDTDMVKGENESELSTLSSPALLAIKRQLDNTISASQEETMSVISQAQSNSSSIEARLRQSEADLLKQKSYSVTLENRISELEREKSNLKHSIDNASSAPDIFSGVEVQLREEVAELKRKLRREGLLMKSYEDLEADRLGFLNTSLRVEYKKLHSNIRNTSSTICHLSLDDALPEQRTGFSHLANNWAGRISGCDLGPLLDHCEAAQIPKRFILAALVAAGIFELVLEDAFPAFLAGDSPLLDQYRKHIETESKHTVLFTANLTCYQETKLTRLGGWNALQRLDVISIKSLLSNKDLRNRIVSERSEWLSSLVVQALSCFLPLESRDMGRRLSHSDAEPETISDMKTTLKYALKFKIELLLSLKRLKYLFFRPGTVFDAEKMEVGQSQAGDTALLGQEVKICLFPALFTLQEASNEIGVGEESGRKANYSKALTEASEKEDKSLVLVEKAVVFLKNVGIENLSLVNGSTIMLL